MNVVSEFLTDPRAANGAGPNLETSPMSDERTLKEARDQYFLDNGFGPDGGYSAAWVDFKLGSLPFPIPNSDPRRDAVRFHDLHHVLTGYTTDFAGELEISAWEIGAGCKRAWFAWQINLGGLAGGLFIAPRLTARAFARGLASGSLYGSDYESILTQTVGETRTQLRLDEAVPALGVRGAALLGIAGIVGLVWGLIQFMLLLPLVPFGLLAGRIKNAQRAKNAPSSSELPATSTR